MGGTDPIRVLVVDDQAFYRRVLSEAVARTAGMVLSGTAPTGEIALRSLCIENVDVVLLDASMPEMDGLDTLKRIRTEFPEVSVVMISGNSVEQARTTVRALASGAVDLIPKPEKGSLTAGMDKLEKGLAELAEMMSLRSGTAQGTFPRDLPTPTQRYRRRMGKAKTVDVHGQFEMVIIGVSAGGPRALERVIPGLPAAIRVPILVVQHMPPHFTSSLAEYLRERSEVDVREARDDSVVESGRVLIAPGGHHMMVEPGPGQTIRIRLDDGPPVNSCRPSVDVLCRSVARCVPGAILAVILTGMGADGAQGVALLKQKGCYCIAQSEQTCAVYGMPRAVIERGLSNETADLDKVAERIGELTGNRA